MRIATATLFLCLQAALASAEDISPWFGSADQKPFRIDVTSTGAVQTDQTPTNSTEPSVCNIAGCPKDGETAIITKGPATLSQN